MPVIRCLYVPGLQWQKPEMHFPRRLHAFRQACRSKRQEELTLMPATTSATETSHSIFPHGLQHPSSRAATFAHRPRRPPSGSHSPQPRGALPQPRCTRASRPPSLPHTHALGGRRIMGRQGAGQPSSLSISGQTGRMPHVRTCGGLHARTCG